MTGSGVSENPWDEENMRPQMLTEAETKELELALQDGFQIHGTMMPGEKYRLDGIVEEPFFGASAGSSSDVLALTPDWLSELRKEGCTEEEVLD
ncbi:MAG: hypothetical protein K5905_30595, partial [Roseibium sp.]|uniref:hypothetical protein n=1 Tax=Roseibium sp. TaxID=1936156 RepID=UPI00260FDBBB